MNKDKGVKNSKIRSYLYERIPEVLNKNPFFVKVYGKDFAKKRLKSGITTVYTNAEPQRKSCLGYHVYSEKAIILCSQEKDDKILTIDDIENDELLKEIILHECIHSILERTKKECFSYGIKNGTGLLERYYANEETGKESELGRGLNEGFTEWLCEKCGYKVLGYSELTNYIRLIELALGTEKVMEFGKGNIYERLPEIMNISYNEVVELLSLGDTLYSLDENINTFCSIWWRTFKCCKY